MLKKIIFKSLFFIFLPLLGFSQSLITGNILDEENNPLPGANVIINKVNQNLVLNFAVSDASGNYELKLNADHDTLEIKVSFLGYRQAKKIILNQNQKLDFKLKPSSKELKEVFIKAPPNPITQNGDTLSYDVDAFKNQKDRVIADVLRKLPGIEVDREGKITYQGRAIQKYYIEGLDLLEGKYNLANNNLPADAVAKVQILQNHQAIRVLDSVEFTDRTSLNIKLKKNITTTGSGELGAGLSPFLWSANLTPMLFTKKQQMISSFQSNNIGDDVAKDLKVLTMENLLEQRDQNTEKIDWLNVQRLSTPNFSEKRWLNNNVNLFSSNYLRRLKKDFEVKVSISYLNDIQKRVGSTQTSIFAANDTIRIFENTENTFFLSSLQSKLSLVKNTKKGYFKNDFEFKNYWDSKKGLISRSDLELTQRVKSPFSSLSNRLKWIVPVGKKKTLVTFYSKVGYTKTAQELKLNVGVFEDLLNEGRVFEQTQQNLNLTNTYTDTNLSFSKRRGKFSLIPKIGFKTQNQNLKTTLNLVENDSTKTLAGDFENDADFGEVSFYSSLKTQFQSKSWKIELFTPLKWRDFEFSDKTLLKNKNINRLVFEPRLSVNKKLTAFWEFGLSANLSNNFGGMNNLYAAFILNSYRNIQRYDSPISQKFRQNYRINLMYSNPIESFFANISYAFSAGRNNLLYQNNFAANGAAVLETLEQTNFSQSHNYVLRLSQYFSEIRTTFGLTSLFSLSNQEKIINNVFSDVANETLQFNGKINADLTDWLTLNYKNKFSFIDSKIANNSNGKISIQEHLLSLSLFPNDRQYIGFEAEYYKNVFAEQTQINYFLNLNYRYSFPKKKIDLEINYLNILNNQNFQTTFNNSFTYLQSSFLLRPSQILATVKFSF